MIHLNIEEEDGTCGVHVNTHAFTFFLLIDAEFLREEEKHNIALLLLSSPCFFYILKLFLRNCRNMVKKYLGTLLLSL